MAGTQGLLATALVFSLANPRGNSRAEPLGIIMQADRASLGSESTAQGTTIYDGDRLSTGAGGSLRLRIGEAMVDLMEESRVIVRSEGDNAAKEFAAELVAGTALLSTTAETHGKIVANGARVRPLAVPRGVVQVRIVGALELLVFARRGPAEVSYHGESETIEEGKSIRVLLNPEQDGSSGALGTKKSGKRGKAFLLIAVGAGTATGIVLMRRGSEGGTGRGVESPDRP